MAAELGLRITGSVYWGALPVPNARLVLKAPGNYYKQPGLAETTAGPDGQFVLAQPPAGDFILYAVSPSPDYWEWSGHSLTVAAGQAVDAGRFELSKKLPLLEPGSDSTVPTLPTPTPVLRWTHFPDAARYAVDVFSDDTHAAVMRHSTTSTSVVVAPALAAGGRYQWSVSADDAQGRALARGGARHFRVQSVEGGAPIASLPTQAAAARQPAADRQRVSGWVAWGAVMVPGARVEMKALGQPDEQPTLAETTTGPDGWFVLDEVPAGEYLFIAYPPSPDYGEVSGRSLAVGGSHAGEAHRLGVMKPLRLLEPGALDAHATVDTPTPVLRWEALPGAINYHVYVVDVEKLELVMQLRTTSTSVTVTPPLTTGRRYQWSVGVYDSEDEEERLLIYHGALFFTVRS